MDLLRARLKALVADRKRHPFRVHRWHAIERETRIAEVRLLIRRATRKERP